MRRHPAHGDKCHRLPVAQRNGAGLVEQEDIDIARCFDGAPRDGDHIALNHAIHAGNANRRKQPANSRGNQADEQGNQDGDGNGRPLPSGFDAVKRIGQQRDADDQKDDGERGQQNVERNLVRRLLALGPFHQADHAIQKAFAGVGRHAHDQPVRENTGAAGDSAAVAAGLAHHRRTLAGDGTLIDRRNPFDNLAIGRDNVTSFDEKAVIFAQCRRGDSLIASLPSGLAEFFRRRLLTGAAQRIGLGFPAAFRYRFRKVGKKHRKPEPERNRPGKASGRFALPQQRLPPENGRQHTANRHDQHHRVAHLPPRIQFTKCFHHRPAIEAAAGGGLGCWLNCHRYSMLRDSCCVIRVACCVLRDLRLRKCR